jgi:hypothetical protein
MTCDDSGTWSRSPARRAVMLAAEAVAPARLRAAAAHARHGGIHACYLVGYQGRYSAWIIGTDPSDRSQVYGMPSELAGRAFTDAWQAMNLLHTPWDERIATIFPLSPSTRNGILYEAALVNVEDSGCGTRPACRGSPWAACWPARTGPGRSSPSSVPPARGSRTHPPPPSPGPGPRRSRARGH